MRPAKRLSESSWQALAEALSTFEWYKAPFETLVRAQFSEAPLVLAAVNFAEPKRTATDSLIRGLRVSEDKYQELVVSALVRLADVDPRFPNLARLEDGASKVDDAQRALQMVKGVVATFSELNAQREALQKQQEEDAARNQLRDSHNRELGLLHTSFMDLLTTDETPQARGKEFEGLLNALFGLWDLDPRAAYDLEHEQIDGAFTLRTDDYLLEARWWAERLQPKELNDFKVKIDGKARNTLGLCVAVNGFTEGAVTKHSQGQSPLILMDGTDLLPILEGRIGLTEVLERKRRHASETGNVLYRVLP